MEQCIKCGDYREIFPEIKPNSDFFFVGKHPGYEEFVQGIPFIGYKTIALRKMMEEEGIKASYTNLVRCFIKNPDKRHVANCLPHLISDIKKADPKIIVFFGKEQAVSFNERITDVFPEFYHIDVDGKPYLVTVFDNPASWIDNPSTGSEQIVDLLSLIRIYKAIDEWNADRFPAIVRKNLLYVKARVLSEFTGEKYELPKSCRCKSPIKNEKLIESGIFRELYNHPWVHDLLKHTDIEFLEDENSIKQMLDSLSGVIAFDFETNKLEIDSEFEIWGYAIATKDTIYFVKALSRVDVRDQIKLLLANSRISKIVCHNLSFELKVMKRYLGIDSGSFDLNRFADTMALWHMIFEKTKRGYGLKAILKSLGVPDYDIGIEEKQQFSIKAAYYNMLDAYFTLRLYLFQDALLSDKRKLLAENLVNKLPFVIEMMEHYGMRIDKEEARRLLEEEINKRDKILDKLHRLRPIQIVRQKKLEELNAKRKKKKIINLPSFNPLSIKDLRMLFFDVLKLKPLKTKKSGPSVDATVLAKMKGKIPKLIMQYREANKLITAFLKKLSVMRKVRSNYHQTGTTSGRLSSSNINLQQIPKELRSIFVPNEGYLFIEIDVARAEAMMFGLLTGHKPTLRVLEKGDFHRWVASLVFNKPEQEISKTERSIAKTATFAVLYFTSPKGLAEGLAQKAGINLSEKRCKKIIDTYHKKLPILSKFRLDCVKQIRNHYYIETPFGRRRQFFVLRYLKNYPVDREFIKQATNHVVQSSLSDLFQLFVIAVYSKIYSMEETVRFVNSVHDSVVIEVREDAVDTVIRLIASATSEIGRFIDTHFLHIAIPVNFEASIGKDWKNVQEYRIIDTNGNIKKFEEEKNENTGNRSITETHRNSVA